MKLVGNSFYVKLFLLALLTASAGCTKQMWHTANVKYERYEVGEKEGTQLEMASLIEPYQKELLEEMQVVIGENVTRLEKERPESSIGNWFADILQEEFNRLSTVPVAFSVQNYGGIRSNYLTEGPITIGAIYEIMPFENLMVTVDLNGAEVEAYCDYMAADRGWPVSAELQYNIVDDKAENVKINGKSVQEDQIYRIGLNDYIARGGDSSGLFKDKEIYEYSLLVRDAIIQHIKRDTENGVVQRASKDGRVKKLD